MPKKSWTPAELLTLSGNYWSTCTLHAGVKLDLFTPLAERAMTAADLAAEKGFSERGLAMLLDALAALELLTKQGDHYRAAPDAAALLDRTAPGYLGHIILHHHNLVDGWSRLDEAVRTGEPVRRRISHEAEESERENFLMGMYNLASLIAPLIAAQVDLSGCRRLLDLGGGPGTYAIHFCQRNPELEAVVFDLPTTRPFAERTLARHGLTDRISFVEGDFDRDPLPGRFDAIWLSHILHAEGPQACARLLDKAVGALQPGGLLLVQEFILQEDRTAPLFPALFSLNMLQGTAEGQAYSEGELQELLRGAGLQKVERLALELPNGAGVVVGRK